MSDCDRILRLLEERGEQGVTTFELRTGGYSGNPSSRIMDLTAQGHNIDAERTTRTDALGKKRPMTVYRLRAGAGGSEVGEASVAACCGPDRSEGDAPVPGASHRRGPLLRLPSILPACLKCRNLTGRVISTLTRGRRLRCPTRIVLFPGQLNWGRVAQTTGPLTQER